LCTYFLQSGDVEVSGIPGALLQVGSALAPALGAAVGDLGENLTALALVQGAWPPRLSLNPVRRHWSGHTHTYSINSHALGNTHSSN